jgi:selenide,water dikinase
MDLNRLTLYSHGAGCGCKISPQILTEIIGSLPAPPQGSKLLVGLDNRDDAAVYDMEDGTALISTADFFMPIVDDPYDFGRIAANNALSDVYAMGGKPFMALGLLGWPVDHLAPTLAGEVMRGASDVCIRENVILAGGHSIDSVEPFFGLSVNGKVSIGQIKTNSGAKPGDYLFLTKPIGTGILSTAAKLERLKEEHRVLLIETMVASNRIGTKLGAMKGVHAMTDVTGFGLLGHALEIARASAVSLSFDASAIPLIDREAVHYYIRMMCVPAATQRNSSSIHDHCNSLNDDTLALLCDPQTSGGLLVCVDPESVLEFKSLVYNELGQSISDIGRVVDLQTTAISVENQLLRTQP